MPAQTAARACLHARQADEPCGRVSLAAVESSQVDEHVDGRRPHLQLCHGDRPHHRGQSESSEGPHTASPSRHTLMPFCVQQALCTSSTHECKSSAPPRPVPPESAAHDAAPRTSAMDCSHGSTKSATAWTSKPRPAEPMNCIRVEHCSQKGTSSSAHSGVHRSGIPALQSGAAVAPQQMGRMSLISWRGPSLSRACTRTARRRAARV